MEAISPTRSTDCDDGYLKFFINVRFDSKEWIVPLQKDDKGNFTNVSLKMLRATYKRANGLYFTSGSDDKKTKNALEQVTLDDDIHILPPVGGWRSQPFYWIDLRIDPTRPEPIGLCLSGGGFRATLFHVGALRRLNEIGILKNIDTISSVSGGSITNAVLAVNWMKLRRENFSSEAFDKYIRDPILSITSNNVAIRVLTLDTVNPSHIMQEILHHKTSANWLAEEYTKLMPEFGIKLSELQDPMMNTEDAGSGGIPNFIFCGTDMRDGQPVYFTRETVGRSILWRNPPTNKYDEELPMETAKLLPPLLTVAEAVAASSAYPIAFQPLLVKIPGTNIEIPVTDGGVYDNLGMDPLLVPPMTMRDIKGAIGHKIIFVSDAGAPLTEIDQPSTHLRILRTISLIGDQVNRLRRNVLKALFRDFDAYGTGWNIDTLEEYSQDTWKKLQSSDKGAFPTIDFINHDVLQLFSTIRTDLNCFSNQEKHILINFGYLCSTFQIYLNVLDYLIELAHDSNDFAFHAPFIWPYDGIMNAQYLKSALKTSDSVFSDISRTFSLT